jgi:hypothetical protein
MSNQSLGQTNKHLSCTVWWYREILRENFPIFDMRDWNSGLALPWSAFRTIFNWKSKWCYYNWENMNNLSNKGNSILYLLNGLLLWKKKSEKTSENKNFLRIVIWNCDKKQTTFYVRFS